eukprot:696335-Pyramimonas_sp.AAC.1
MALSVTRRASNALGSCETKGRPWSSLRVSRAASHMYCFMYFQRTSAGTCDMSTAETRAESFAR